jgi:hypothetical protein
MTGPTITGDMQDLSSPWRRRIELSARDGEMRVALEDQFHRFRLAIHHECGRVVGFAPATLRAPTTLCPLAGAALEGLIGMPLPASPLDVTAVSDHRDHCTHLLDLAALGMAAASRGVRRRSYRAEIVPSDERTAVASLQRDGVAVMTWEVSNGCLAKPTDWAGLNLRSGFTRWVAETLRGDDVEAALILRRAFLTSRGRRYPLGATLPTSPQGCWVLQPGRNGASRTIGSTRDFALHPEALGHDDEQWIDWGETQGSGVRAPG